VTEQLHLSCVDAASRNRGYLRQIGPHHSRVDAKTKGGVVPRRILVTGGAGFIGRHVCQALLEQGHLVRVIDRLHEQVHDHSRVNPIIQNTDFILGDVRDADLVQQALRGCDAVVHLAAEVGVGQSMYEIERYVATNDLGTAVLLQSLLTHPVERIVVASSMSIYGEGLYRAADGSVVEDAVRSPNTRPGEWDPTDEAGEPLLPIPTPETKRPSLASVYAINKFVQERLVLTVARAYGISGVALRLFNVYGPGQALSNPYTGVLAIFASRLLNGNRPSIFEDGLQRRDFVHVEDVANAFLLALDTPGIAGQVFNVGSGRSITISEVAKRLAAAMGTPDLTPHVLGKARAGDIRHCFADITLARRELGFLPRRSLDEGMQELVAWVEQQNAVDRASEATRELELRGLVA
jgi:dTDP-L-rhamnose 4-epimerase